MLSTILLYNFILFFSTLLLYVSEYDRTPIVRKICLIASFLIVVIPSAIRFEIGADYTSYVSIFEEIQSGAGSKELESGFRFIIEIIQVLGLNSDWLFIVIAILIHFFLFLSYPTKRKYVFHFFIMLIMYFESFNILRQVLAVSIVMYALKSYNSSNKYFSFILKTLFATLFHKVAIIFLIIPLFINKFGKRLLINFGWATILLWLGALVSGIVFINTAVLLISNISFLDYSYYLTTDRYGSTNKLNIYGYMNVTVILLLYFYPFLFTKKVISNNPKSLLAYILFFLHIMFWILSYKLVILYRLQQALSFSLPLILVTVLSSNHIHRKKIYVTAMAIFLLSSFNMKILSSHTNATVSCNSGRLSPYVTIFNKEDSQRASRTRELLCYQ